MERLLFSPPRTSGRTRFRVLFRAWLLLVIRLGFAVGPDFQVTSWQREDGLPDHTITALAQTPDGYLLDWHSVGPDAVRWGTIQDVQLWEHAGFEGPAYHLFAGGPQRSPLGRDGDWWNCLFFSSFRIAVPTQRAPLRSASKQVIRGSLKAGVFPELNVLNRAPSNRVRPNGVPIQR